MSTISSVRKNLNQMVGDHNYKDCTNVECSSHDSQKKAEHTFIKNTEDYSITYWGWECNDCGEFTHESEGETFFYSSEAEIYRIDSDVFLFADSNEIPFSSKPSIFFKKNFTLGTILSNAFFILIGLFVLKYSIIVGLIILAIFGWVAKTEYRKKDWWKVSVLVGKDNEPQSHTVFYFPDSTNNEKFINVIRSKGNKIGIWIENKIINLHEI